MNNTGQTAPSRAKPLALEERQAMIIDAVLPLLVEHGRDVTSKQIAEAAGIAEGTIFRAFGDKDSLIDAAIERALDPEPMFVEMRAIDPAAPLATKMLDLITALQRRFGEVFRIMTAIGHQRHNHPSQREGFAALVAEILAPELDQLALPAHRVAHLIRMVAFSTAFPQLNHGMEFTPEELTALVLHGIVLPAPDSPAPDPTQGN